MGRKGDFSEGNRTVNQICHDDCRTRNTFMSGYRNLIVVLFVFIFILCFRAYAFERIIVSGNSMNPSYANGDVVWVQKFNIYELSRYKVVVADMEGKLVMKRVIGLPNETIQIIDQCVYINGEALKDDYGYQTSIYGCTADEVLLGIDEYFLLGDNRDNSLDCRIWGAVNTEKIKGLVIFRFFPFWKIGIAE